MIREKLATDKDVDEAYLRVLNRMAEGFDIAACIAILGGLSRKDFMNGAGRAYDFVLRWHEYHTREDMES